ncbi:hypothetical protein [Microbacterium sp. A84]|uniref:hypothetical protein n=1 Tax=Microbacterium sp. A84 TaxID=3450715 RepID=UPI003F437195
MGDWFEKRMHRISAHQAAVEHAEDEDEWKEMPTRDRSTGKVAVTAAAAVAVTRTATWDG